VLARAFPAIGNPGRQVRCAASGSGPLFTWCPTGRTRERAFLPDISFSQSNPDAKKLQHAKPL
jgi:hypothetical protein